MGFNSLRRICEELEDDFGAGESRMGATRVTLRGLQHLQAVKVESLCNEKFYV
jgi:hypothetical protein